MRDLQDFLVRRAARLGLFVIVFSGLSAGLSAGSAAAAGAVWPLTPRPAVVRGFEPPPEPWLPGHRGVDLLGNVGRPVRAASAGTVAYAGPLAGRGVVVISHGPTRTTYEPVVPSVDAGDHVLPGDPIGTLSAAPSHCAPRICLHWGLLRGPTYLNPLSLLSSTPVRLLANADHAAPPGTDRAAQPPMSDHAARAPATDPAARPASGTLGDRTRGSVDTSGGAEGSPGGGRPAVAEDQRGEQAVARSNRAGGVFVGVAAVLTIAGGLLIRRH
jgi:murein DD-endopeptidase MepM/ murein hydrolase activator NlpD